MGAISGDRYSSPNENSDRATTGVFSSRWESFKQDLESLKLDWKSVEVQLNTDGWTKSRQVPGEGERGYTPIENHNWFRVKHTGGGVQ